jgi:hypothetical protein
MILDFIFCLFALVFGFRFIYRFNLFNAYDLKLLKKLFFYHLLAGIGYYLFIINNGGDATNYWFATYDFRYYNFDDVIDEINTGSATGYMLLLNYFPAKLLGLTFFTGSILYTVLGFVSFVYFYATIKIKLPNIYELKRSKIFGFSIFPGLLFLPNLHFWSSGLGKDTLLFFCIALFFYSSLKVSKRFFGIIVSMGLSFAIRPHMTLFMLMALGLGIAFDGRLKSYQKVFITLVFTGVFVGTVNYVMNFVQLESLDTETVTEYSNTRASNLADKKGTTSAVDTTSYPYPLKIFTFLFRPLFFDANGILGIVASLENLFLLLFFIKIIRNKPLKGFKYSSYLVKASGFLFLMGALSFSLILGNLGIMLRQKTPFVMMLIIFGYSIILTNKHQKTLG